MVARELTTIIQIFVAVLVADMFWFRYAYPKYYRKMFHNLNQPRRPGMSARPWNFRLLPAAGSWFVLACGIWYFGVRPSQGMVEGLINGGLFGAFVYGVYNLTNYATLRDYRWNTAVTDTMWGIGLCALTSALFVLVGSSGTQLGGGGSYSYSSPMTAQPQYTINTMPAGPPAISAPLAQGPMTMEVESY